MDGNVRYGGDSTGQRQFPWSYASCPASGQQRTRPGGGRRGWASGQGAPRSACR